jgi:hypothetical protein
MGSSQPGGDACRDGDRPVDAGRDDAVRLLRGGEHPDRRLVLRGDYRAAVRELEARGAGIAVDREDEEPTLARRPQQAELGRAGP